MEKSIYKNVDGDWVVFLLFWEDCFLLLKIDNRYLIVLRNYKLVCLRI